MKYQQFEKKKSYLKFRTFLQKFDLPQEIRMKSLIY